MARRIRQGDAYPILMKLRDADGVNVGTLGVSGAQVKIGTGTGAITKEYPDGGLTYDSTAKKWSFSLTQEQTYAMSGEVEIQAQVKYTSGVVASTRIRLIHVLDSIITKVWTDSSDEDEDDTATDDTAEDDTTDEGEEE